MDPITSFAVGHVGGKLADRFGRFMRTVVVDRARSRRAQEFVDAFCHAAAMDVQPDVLEEMLEEVLSDDLCQELLFDAYRRIALSASSSIGPRIIGLLMARTVGTRREPNEEEERVLTAATMLSDKELIAAEADWRSGLSGTVRREEHFRYEKDGGERKIEYFVLDGAPGHNTGYEYWLLLGTWAGKLNSLGLTWTVDRVVPSPPSGNGHGSFDTSTALQTDLYYSAAYALLMDLIKRVHQMEVVYSEQP